MTSFLVNNQLEMIYKEETQKIMKNVNHDSQTPGRHLNPGPPVYEGGILDKSIH